MTGEGTAPRRWAWQDADCTCTQTRDELGVLYHVMADCPQHGLGGRRSNV